MWLFLIACLLFALTLPDLSMLALLKTQFVFLQQHCSHLNPFETSTGELWKALVCGQNLQRQNPWLNSLKTSGLIHIFIVSGSHFLVLQVLLQKLKPRFFISVLLWIFNAATGFSAPGTRACLQITSQSIFRMRPDQNLLASSLLCLALCPSWIQSQSFWLSWLASLVLIISPRDFLRIAANSLFFSVWSCLGFTLSLWSLPLNILIAPLIGWVLFPLALLCFLKPAQWLFEFLLMTLESLLKLLHLGEQKTIFMNALSTLSFLVLMTHLILQIYFLYRQGRQLK